MYMTENLQGRQRLDALAEELNGSRRQALDLSKKYQKLKETAKSGPVVPERMGGHSTTTISLLPATSSAPSKPKFVGGGFNLLSSVPLSSVGPAERS